MLALSPTTLTKLTENRFVRPKHWHRGPCFSSAALRLCFTSRLTTFPRRRAVGLAREPAGINACGSNTPLGNRRAPLPNPSVEARPNSKPLGPAYR